MTRSTVCPKCNVPLSGVCFCTQCGTKTEPMPVCQFDDTAIWPHEAFCGTCGKPRTEAIGSNTPDVEVEEDSEDGLYDLDVDLMFRRVTEAQVEKIEQMVDDLMANLPE